MKSFILFLAICIAINTLHVEHNGQIFPTGRVQLQSDSGKFLARCNGCGPSAYPDVAGIHAASGSGPWQAWTVQIVGDKVAFKSDSGKYLSRCNGCWTGGAYPDSAQVHVTTPNGNPWALWTPIQKSNGKWAFQSDNGKFLARCNGCVRGGAYPDFAFVHQSNSDNAWAQWSVTPAFGSIALQADTGKVVARCNNCGPSAYPDMAGVHAALGSGPWAKWTIENQGNGQVAFKADTGKYLARCNNCWRYGASPDAAAVHVTTPSGNPWSVWRAQWHPATGKWAFKADSGKYLARCNGCVGGGAYPDFAFVHQTNPENPWASFNVVSQ